MEITELPNDPTLLLCCVNTKLRDSYAGDDDATGLDRLCDDLGLDKDKLTARLADAGFEYSPEQNRFW